MTSDISDAFATGRTFSLLTNMVVLSQIDRKDNPRKLKPAQLAMDPEHRLARDAYRRARTMAESYAGKFLASAVHGKPSRWHVLPAELAAAAPAQKWFVAHEPQFEPFQVPEFLSTFCSRLTARLAEGRPLFDPAHNPGMEKHDPAAHGPKVDWEAARSCLPYRKAMIGTLTREIAAARDPLIRATAEWLGRKSNAGSGPGFHQPARRTHRALNPGMPNIRSGGAGACGDGAQL